MAALGVVVQVVRVDVEGHEADGVEGRRVDDGHVVGGVYADSCYVGAGTRAHIGDAVLPRMEDTRHSTALTSFIKLILDLLMKVHPDPGTSKFCTVVNWTCFSLLTMSLF